MASTQQRALVIKVTSDTLKTLPNLEKYYTLFRTFDPTTDTSLAISSSNQNYVQWIRHPDRPFPTPGPSELSAAVHAFRPKRIYIVLPSKPVKELSTNEIKPLLEVEQALRSLITPNLSGPSQQQSRSKLITESLCRVTLLFDEFLMQEQVIEYKAVFYAHEMLCGAAASSILASRVDNVTTINSRWSGSIHIPDDVQSPEDGTSFPGFHLIPENESTPAVPTKRAPHAHVLAVAKSMPAVACLFNARLGFQLRLAQDCPARTASFFNALVSSGESMLVRIGDAKFWCFWSSKRGDAVATCHAMFISPLSRAAVPALDVAGWRVQQGFGNKLSVRALPPELANLPVRSLFQSASEVSTPENINVDIAFLKEALDIHRKRNDLASNHPGNDALLNHLFFSPSHVMTNDISGAELQALEKREKEKEKEQATNSTTPYAKLTNTVTRSDSCSILESKSVTGKKPPVTSREMQLAFRQRRFQRLMQTQQEKRVVENATTVSSMGQRGKRIRSTETDTDRRVAKAGRLSSSSIYLGQAIRSSLHALDKCKPFYNLDGTLHARSESSIDLANRLNTVVGDGDAANFDPDWMKTARREQGNHGVEYLFDSDNRDKHIIEYEHLIAKTSVEFGTKTLQPRERSKLKAAINRLRSLPIKGLQPEVSDNRFGDNITSQMELLKDLFEGFRRGVVIVKDETLRARLLQTSFFDLPTT